MSNVQKWVVIVLVFILAMTITVGSFTYGILKAPAATSKIDIDADMWFEASKDGKLELQSIHLNRIQGEFSSKILDLIIMGLR